MIPFGAKDRSSSASCLDLYQPTLNCSGWAAATKIGTRRGCPSVASIIRTFTECFRRFMFFRFPPNARWNPQRSVVEFGIGVREYEGVVRVSRRVFQILPPEAPTPERCLQAFDLHRTRLELIAERKVRRRQLTEEGNIEITGRDLREREVRGSDPRPIGYRRAAS